MAVKTSDEPNLAHDFDDDDDDGPVIYKRYSSSKKNQLHSDVRKSSSHSHDGQISNAPSAKPSPVKPSVGISNASNSLINTSSMKLPVANPKSPSLGDKQKMSIDVKEKSKSIDYCAKDYCEDSEDDEDNKPFSVGAGDGQNKRTTLVHNAVIFPPYQPHGVKMLYKGKPAEQEEPCEIQTDYMPKDRFKENFWNDWRKLLGRNHVIQNLKDCDFIPIYDWYQSEKEKKKGMTAEVYPRMGNQNHRGTASMGQ
ncbi:hypothetical protein GLYMA_12G013500v4 [Glycine max]|uniref:DNA topoisomerase I DNA binding eukaryotic-type domain-containing protein n=2 Tax=Glycine subgen. Soja TaxID=1462606 RepID=K7LSE9_SOYBN|nr:hypothetical protein GYH30_032374 [Glycine max]KHN46494.1 DNA topoisomerase 1 [Glycine soja]KRH23965.1 hypothetical protein GLYMA_12G013500v4 [Glycine max]RZB73719.1 DNA topoisomerase 1 alpha [Glycine soja]